MSSKVDFGALAAHVASALGAMQGYGFQGVAAVKSLEHVQDVLMQLYEAAKASTLDKYSSPKQTLDNEQPVELPFNSHADKRLTKSGGLSFTVWSYILMLENKAHGNPTGESVADQEAWREYYDNDHTPHGAIEEDFNYA